MIMTAESGANQLMLTNDGLEPCSLPSAGFNHSTYYLTVHTLGRLICRQWVIDR